MTGLSFKVSIAKLDVVKAISTLKDAGFHPQHQKSSLIVPIENFDMLKKWFTLNLNG